MHLEGLDYRRYLQERTRDWWLRTSNRGWMFDGQDGAESKQIDGLLTLFRRSRTQEALRAMIGESICFIAAEQLDDLAALRTSRGSSPMDESESRALRLAAHLTGMATTIAKLAQKADSEAYEALRRALSAPDFAAIEQSEPFQSFRAQGTALILAELDATELSDAAC